jgi:replication fork protection complex subunit Tof1/Swi1
MFKNSHMRLLMNLSGLQLLDPASEETPESAWIIPADVTADSLQDAIHYINQAEFSPPTFEEGVLAEHQLKRKLAPRKRAAFDDDEEGEDDDAMFEALGPTVRQAIDDDRPKKSPKKRKSRKELTEEEREQKRIERREREHQKLRKLKSQKHVRGEDDETDEEYDAIFFARERAFKEQNDQIYTAATRPGLVSVAKKPTKKPAKKSAEAATESESSEDDKDESDEDESEEEVVDEDEDEEEEAADSNDDGMAFVRRAMNNTLEEEEETGETQPDGSDGESRKRRRISVEKTQPDKDEEMGGMDKEGEDDEDDMPFARKPRVRGGFIVSEDDDDDE